MRKANDSYECKTGQLFCVPRFCDEILVSEKDSKVVYPERASSRHPKFQVQEAGDTDGFECIRENVARADVQPSFRSGFAVLK